MNIKLMHHTTLYILLPLIIGSLMYILLRSDTLLVFDWLGYINANELVYSAREYTLPLVRYIPFHILYSLPDGIWVYCATLSLLLVWKPKDKSKYLWASIPFICAASAELLQLTYIVPGTFEVADLIAYITGGVAAYIIDRRRIKE